MKQAGFPFLIKRATDIALSGAVLLAASPILAAGAFLVRAQMGSPVIFRQVRPGKDAKPFTVYKLRTMRDASGPDGASLSDAERLTSLGATLRKLSIDELPQLWNVVRGDMSLVGPRPLLWEYLPRYSPEQARRHEVLPGITGLAQVSGRNAVQWEERFRLDVQYIDTWSPWLDFAILGRTALAVLQRRGISAPGHATAPNFMGTARSTPEPAGSDSASIPVANADCPPVD